MPATAQRGHAPISPMNRTGQIYQEQLRAKQARDAAKDVDIDQVKRQEYLRGHSDGVTYGFTEGWNALGELLIESGFITEDRLLEIVNSIEDEPGDAARS